MDISVLFLGGFGAQRTHLPYEFFNPLVDFLRRVIKFRRHFLRFLEQRHLVRSRSGQGLVEDRGVRADSGRVYAGAVAQRFSKYGANIYRRRWKELKKKDK